MVWNMFKVNNKDTRTPEWIFLHAEVFKNFINRKSKLTHKSQCCPHSETSQMCNFFKDKLHLQLFPKYLRQTLVFKWNGDVQFLFFWSFLLLLTKFHFERKTGKKAIILYSFEIFLIFPNFLRHYILKKILSRIFF